MNLSESRSRLEEIEKAREELLKLVREMKINSTKAIAAIHSGEDHTEYLKKALETLKIVLEYKKFPEVYYSITHDAMQELVEAVSFVYFVNDKSCLDIDLPVEASSLITGLADVIGELRRYALSQLVKGNFREAKRAMDEMEKIYYELISFTTLPDKLVPGLRHKLDVGRGCIERTKSDYIAAKVARKYEDLGRN